MLFDDLIDTSEPINWEHPLNARLVSWWLGIPGRTGSVLYYDIAALNHGTLTGGPAWASGQGQFCGVQLVGSTFSRHQFRRQCDPVTREDGP